MGLFGLIGAILVKLLLNLRLSAGLSISAVLVGADRVALILGEKVVEVQLLFLHRYNYRISAIITLPRITRTSRALSMLLSTSRFLFRIRAGCTRKIAASTPYFLDGSGTLV